MKKALLAILATAGVAFLSPTVGAQNKSAETMLLPEVAAIVLHAERPNEAALKQDVYAALLAMDAPEGADYMAIGSKIILNNFDYLQKSIQMKSSASLTNGTDGIDKHFEKKSLLSLNLNIGKDRYLFSCANIYAPECATDTLNKKETVATLINNNATLMKRYLQTTKFPHYGVYHYGVADPMPNYQNIVHLSYMRLAQALIAFDANHIDQGFALLEAEMAFTKRMLAQDKMLIGQMVTIRKLYSLYHTISVAMDMPQLRAHTNDKRWAALLAPLTLTEQKGMAQAFATERNLLLYAYYALDNNGMDVVDLSGNRTPATPASKSTFMQTYDRNETCNIQYLTFAPVIQRALLPLKEISKLAQQKQLKSTSEEINDVLNAQIQLSRKKSTSQNRIGYELLQFASPNFQSNLDRRYDVQIYGALVNAKRLMIQANVGTDKVETFLKNGGTQTRNPYTQETFAWNAQTQTLSTPWLFIHTGISGEEKNMQVQVPSRN